MYAHKSVNCSVCDKPFKLECVGISSTEARQIHHKFGLTWTCKQCIQVSSDINSLRRVIIDLQNKIKMLKSSLLTHPPLDSAASLLEYERSCRA